MKITNEQRIEEARLILSTFPTIEEYTELVKQANSKTNKLTDRFDYFIKSFCKAIKRGDETFVVREVNDYERKILISLLRERGFMFIYHKISGFNRVHYTISRDIWYTYQVEKRANETL